MSNTFNRYLRQEVAIVFGYLLSERQRLILLKTHQRGHSLVTVATAAVAYLYLETPMKCTKSSTYCPFIQVLAAACAIALTAWLGYAARRTDFNELLLAFLALFGLYGWGIWQAHFGRVSWRMLVALGIFLRALLLFSTPNLSDDVYRFLWDGRLSAQGVHPFAHTPAQVMASGQALVGITPALFAQLNSPEYHTVYPPVCQGVFWAAARIFPESTEGGVLVLKVFLFMAELLAIWALWRLRGQSWAVVAYALHPLVILEGVGNAHFEVAMIAFLWVALLLIERRHWRASAFFWVLAVGVKLLPLLFLPILWVYLDKRVRWLFLSYFALFCALLSIPLWSGTVLQNLFSSLRLYFEQFAFNAGIYYGLRELLVVLEAKEMMRARWLGVLLGGLVFVGVWMIALYRAKSPQGFSLADRMTLASALYLLLATTVHPWYVLVPFALALASARRPTWCFPQVWAAAAVLSYSHYAGGHFQEKYGYIAIEYGAVMAALAWDFWQPFARTTLSKGR